MEYGLVNCIHCLVVNGEYNTDSLWFVPLENQVRHVLVMEICFKYYDWCVKDALQVWGFIRSVKSAKNCYWYGAWRRGSSHQAIGF